MSKIKIIDEISFPYKNEKPPNWLPYFICEIHMNSLEEKKEEEDEYLLEDN
ncbi:MAG: hypothetical protein JXA60_02520 [Candidatus Coatesbacteria bacterium]|nr:hypothetical protein [Candidatus Coatesbacteria bacterium]